MRKWWRDEEHRWRTNFVNEAENSENDVPSCLYAQFPVMQRINEDQTVLQAKSYRWNKSSLSTSMTILISKYLFLWSFPVLRPNLLTLSVPIFFYIKVTQFEVCKDTCCRSSCSVWTLWIDVSVCCVFHMVPWFIDHLLLKALGLLSHSRQPGI